MFSNLVRLTLYSSLRGGFAFFRARLFLLAGSYLVAVEEADALFDHRAEEAVEVVQQLVQLADSHAGSRH